MCISQKYKFIFIHNQKTAGVSIRWYLRQNVPDLKMPFPVHTYAVDGIKKMGRERWDDYYSFGFVRNPWARLVSWYSMIIERPNRRNKLWKYVRAQALDFEGFLTNCTKTIIHPRRGYIYKKSLVCNQLDYFTDANGEIAVDFIGKVEKLRTDFPKVQKNLGLPLAPLPKTNTTKKKDYRAFYTDHTRELVEERFQKDIAHFKYTFDNG